MTPALVTWLRIELRSASLRYERRRRHSLYAAHIKIFCVGFVQKFDRDPINTTGIRQTINTVASLGNNDMFAIRQMSGDLFAVLWRRDRIHVAGKNQHRRV